jgi:hypothetical protein
VWLVVLVVMALSLAAFLLGRDSAASVLLSRQSYIGGALRMAGR